MSDPAQIVSPRLKAQGYAPGNYMCRCTDCDSTHTADKRAWRCERCADIAATAAEETAIATMSDPDATTTFPTDDMVDACCIAAERAGLMSAHTGKGLYGQEGPFRAIMRQSILPALLDHMEAQGFRIEKAND